MFRNWVFQNFPFLENDFDAITDYELFCKMVEYAKSLSITNEQIVNEIESNLERMYQEGKFDSLIEELINLQTTFTFNSVNDMKNATNLIDGSFTRTSGFYSYNDGGGAYYKIREKLENDVIDEMFIISINDSNLIAELIIKDNKINVRQVGITGQESDITNKLQLLFTKGYDIYFPNGIYIIKNTLNLTSHNLIGEDYNNTIIKYNGIQNGELINSYNINKLMIQNLCFDFGNLTDVTKTGINLYSTNDLKIINCEFKNGYGSHLRLNGSQNVLIENCYFHDITGTTGNMGNAIYCHPISNLTVSKCRCNNLKEDFLYLDGETEDPVKNVYVNNNHLEYTGYNNNETSANTIGVNGNCQNIIISNNVINNNINGIKFAERYGIIPSNIYIYNNTIQLSSQNGISAEGNNINIYQNVINDNNQDGIYVKNSSKVTIDNNTVYNSGRNGLYCNNSTYITINNCISYDNATTGLLIGVNSSNICEHVMINNCHVYKTNDGEQVTGIQVIYANDIQINSCKSYNNSSINWDVQRGTTTNLISQLNPTARSQVQPKNITYSDTIPVDQTYSTGDIILFTEPTTYIGAVCIEGGTPGTWKNFGNIEN